jgi:hypothetical protein
MWCSIFCKKKSLTNSSWVAHRNWGKMWGSMACIFFFIKNCLGGLTEIGKLCDVLWSVKKSIKIPLWVSQKLALNMWYSVVCKKNPTWRSHRTWGKKMWGSIVCKKKIINPPLGRHIWYSMVCEKMSLKIPHGGLAEIGKKDVRIYVL